MPAHWVNLLLRIEAVLDQAHDQLSQADHGIFIESAIRNVIRRRRNPANRPLNHPAPSSTPAPVRDPTGEDADSG
jgi:hypothetical protein